MRFILQRMGQGLIVILAALTLSFILMFVIGDPVTMITGAEASREQAERLCSTDRRGGTRLQRLGLRIGETRQAG
jgi:ABC-type dipeptide/oligopeptide/nickel transport system permease component